MITLNNDQQRIHDRILDFIRSRRALFTVGGYAGTGKTTLIGQVVETLRKDPNAPRIAFCAYTGKAAQVLKSKVLLYENDYCGTIHGLIYRLIDKQGRKCIWERVESIDHDLIILDEASMVNGEIFEDLSSYGVPILAVGDHGQLPPVSGKFNLMEHPEEKLETIVRQAQDNPIIKLSMMARVDGFIPYGEYGAGIAKVHQMPKPWPEADIVLCGINRTRVNINSYLRDLRGFGDKYPMVGESVICLKNNRKAGIYNGMIGTLQEIILGSAFHEVVITFPGNEEDFEFDGMVLSRQFGQKYPEDVQFADLFDWAYCITVHKAQGSEFGSVILMEERNSRMDDEQWRRWLYTGVTRAREKLLIVSK